MMSIKTVNALSHYTDWTIGHVHSGALGWVAMITIGSMYFLIPKLFNRKLYSLGLVDVHFWVSTVGIVLYIASMWIAGVMQGLMWRAVNNDGTLTYSFVETVSAMHPFYIVRMLGGACFFVGMLIMTYNLWRTVAGAKPATATIPVSALA
jgi:cytochrome c oxidase cbb3-type subunit 1